MARDRGWWKYSKKLEKAASSVDKHGGAPCATPGDEGANSAGEAFWRREKKPKNEKRMSKSERIAASRWGMVTASIPGMVDCPHCSTRVKESRLAHHVDFLCRVALSWRQIRESPCFRAGCNSGKPPAPAANVRPLAARCSSELRAFASRVQEAIHIAQARDLLPEIISTHPTRASSQRKDSGELPASVHKHVAQHAGVVSALDERRLLQPSNIFAEFGAGKGMLALAVCEAALHAAADHNPDGPNVASASGCVLAEAPSRPLCSSAAPALGCHRVTGAVAHPSDPASSTLPAPSAPAVLLIERDFRPKRNSADTALARLCRRNLETAGFRRIQIDIRDLHLEGALAVLEGRERSACPLDAMDGTRPHLPCTDLSVETAAETAGAASGSSTPVPLSTASNAGTTHISGIVPPRSRSVVAISKHLCGVATDLALRCLSTYAVSQPIALPVDNLGCDSHENALPGVRSGAPLDAPFGGLAIAVCCHQLCTWEDYVGAQWWLLDEGHGGPALSPEDFELARCCSVWASKHKSALDEAGAHGAAFAPGAHEPDEPLTATEKAVLGLHCKRLIDAGRIAFLRHCAASEVGPPGLARAALRAYCALDVTCENFLIEAGGSPAAVQK